MSRTTPEPNLPVAEASADQIENGCRGMYGPTWDGPPEKMPGEKMKEVWRTYSKNCLNAALATPIPDTSPGERFSFFGENVDRWGAAQWFDRLAKAVREQDKAVIAKDDVGLEICQNVVASSAMRLVRDYEQQVRTALDPPSSAGERMREALEDCREYFTGKRRPEKMIGMGHPHQPKLIAKIDLALAALALQGPSGETGGEG